MPTLVFILAMVIVGGLRSTWGPVFGAMAMMLLVELAKSMGDVRNMAVGVVLALFVVLFPKGLAGAARAALDAAFERRQGSARKSAGAAEVRPDSAR